MAGIFSPLCTYTATNAACNLYSSFERRSPVPFCQHPSTAIAETKHIREIIAQRDIAENCSKEAPRLDKKKKKLPAYNGHNSPTKYQFSA